VNHDPKAPKADLVALAEQHGITPPDDTKN